jgi:hypothetical protein
MGKAEGGLGLGIRVMGRVWQLSLVELIWVFVVGFDFGWKSHYFD